MDWTTFLTIISSTSLLGNVIQFVTLRETKDKARYEADNTHIVSLQKVIELQSDEIRRLQERVEQLEKKIELMDENK